MEPFLKSQRRKGRSNKEKHFVLYDLKEINNAVIRNKIMKLEKKTFRIVVLEDSEFFNDLLTKQLEQYTGMLAMERNCLFEIHSYTSPADFIRNLKNDTDIAFVDYYLGNGVTGLDILKKIRQKCWDCKVVILSQARNIKTAAISRSVGVTDFIFKDVNALPRSCFIIDDLAQVGIAPHQNN